MTLKILLLFLLNNMTFNLLDDLVSDLLQVIKAIGSPKRMILGQVFFHKLVNRATLTIETKRHPANKTLNPSLGRL